MSERKKDSKKERKKGRESLAYESKKKILVSRPDLHKQDSYKQLAVCPAPQ